MYPVLGIIRFNIEEKVKETNTNSLTFHRFSKYRPFVVGISVRYPQMSFVWHRYRACATELGWCHVTRSLCIVRLRSASRTAPPPPPPAPPLLSRGAPTLVRRAAPSRARSSRARSKPERCVITTNSGAQTGTAGSGNSSAGSR